MRYLYYPGCSLEGTAAEYDRSTRALMGALDVELVQIEDWTCCGAGAAAALSRRLSLALPARVLAAAEAMGEAADVCVPCSACYVNLKRVEREARKDRAVLEDINAVLAGDGLALRNRLRVRHLLDILSADIGAAAVGERVLHRFAGWTVAPYYGCQCLRPYAVFDDPERPRSMEPLIGAVGARVHRWSMAAKCCGASHMNTKPAVALKLVDDILEDARGADLLLTVCPMCQMNLEAYQKEVSRAYGGSPRIPVLYLPQLIGLAAGLSEEETGLALNLSVDRKFRQRLYETLDRVDAA